jgi:CRISPR-associated endonuclease Cas2
MEVRWLVTYDVASDKSRTRLAKELAKYGVRVQLSVFDLDCQRGLVEALREYAVANLLGPNDSVIFQPVSDTARRARLTVGKPNLLPDKRWWVI